jgi:formiminoglutamate deiminase
MRVFRCEAAWIDGVVRRDVDITVDDSGRIASLGSSPDAPLGSDRAAADRVTAEIVELSGMVLPGFANAHSHAFHRALRGRTHDGGGTFWTWRERMYEVARVLDPDLYYLLARAVFAEMALSGVTCVGEFHYLHHAPGGAPYDNPNAMGEAVRRAARDAGIRLTLLDTCYLAGGLGAEGHLPLQPDQLRFADADAAAWVSRFNTMSGDAFTIIGAAIHSVRAVPREQIAAIVQAASGVPLHVHLSEQPAENDSCRAAYGLSPTQLLAAEGVLGPRTTVVHATHLSDTDIEALGSSRTSVCLCPTTERDLADGIGPAVEMSDAGSPLCLGTDQHAVIDLLEEARGLEMHERLRSGVRGRFGPADLIDALTVRGHQALGWQDAGRIAVGSRADLVAIRMDTARTAGSDPAQVVLTAFAGDIDTVVVDGTVIVAGGRHESLDVPAELGRTISEVWARVSG